MIGRPPTLVLASNSSWNLAHFRAPLIDHWAGKARLVALVPEDSNDAKLASKGVEVIDVPLDRAGRSVLGDARLFASYTAALRRIRPDAFLGFTPKPNIYGGLAARLCGVPSILNVSGLGTGFLEGKALERLMRQLYRLALRDACTVFFHNRDDLDTFVEGKLVRPKAAQVLPGSGVDLVRFAAAPPRRADGQTRFLLIARMLRDKGVVEFVEAARQLRAEGAPAQFMLLGPAGDDNRSAIGEEQLKSWQAEGLVDWLGPTDDVRHAIRDADVVVLPSYREGLPRTLLEAAAVGRPVITTDVPGCRDAVVDGRTGLLCKARDASSLAATMLRMVDIGADGRAAMGKANRRRAEQTFDQRIVVARYDDALAACGISFTD